MNQFYSLEHEAEASSCPKEVNLQLDFVDSDQFQNGSCSRRSANPFEISCSGNRCSIDTSCRAREPRSSFTLELCGPKSVPVDSRGLQPKGFETRVPELMLN